MAQMASGNAKKASGTFTGSGTVDAPINIGFEPDVIYVWADVDYSAIGWSGIGMCVLIRNLASHNAKHNSVNGASVTNYFYHFGDNGGFGNDTDAPGYTNYATYQNGILTISNKSTAGTGQRFMSDHTYNWVAFAAL